MGLVDKFKNLFTEEVEEVKPIKKEVRHVEIPSPKKEIEPLKVSEEKNTISDSTAIKKDEKFVFPVYFDDKDFDDLEKPKQNKKNSKKVTRTEGYQGTLRKDTPVENNKTFKPSLIISPVYGVLDKNYHKEDILDRNIPTPTYYKSDNMTVDDIRNKAYGTLEDELKNNVLGNEEFFHKRRKNTETAIDLFNELDFDKLDQEKSKNNLSSLDDNNNDLLFDDNSFDEDTALLAKQLEEQKKKLDEINDYIQENTVEKKKKEKSNENNEIKEESPEEEIVDDSKTEDNKDEEKLDDKDNQKKDETIEEELNKEDLTQSELFNLIDSMYEEKEEE